MRKINLLMLAVFILSLAAGAFAQTNFTISVEVMADNKATKVSVKRNIETSLRAIDDVELKETGAFFKMRVILKEIKTPKVGNLGYTMGTVITYESSCVSDGKESPCDVFRDLILQTGTSTRSLSTEMVATFERNTLKILREMLK